MRPIIAHIQIESKIPPILIIQATPLKKKPLDGLHLRLLLRCNRTLRLDPRCRQCNTALGLEPRSPAEGRHWARECRPKAVTGLHWARECRPKAVTGHGSAGRRPSLACTGHGSARPKANTPVPVRHCLHPGCEQLATWLVPRQGSRGSNVRVGSLGI